mmetsp:Transcript_29549/g.52916  ORF Transcript_29549/g.52916 Transcript_29549/m.52916 type:complete len:485 (-) Transcript_29549:397-1851(-)
MKSNDGDGKEMCYNSRCAAAAQRSMTSNSVGECSHSEVVSKYPLHVTLAPLHLRKLLQLPHLCRVFLSKAGAHGPNLNSTAVPGGQVAGVPVVELKRVHRLHLFGAAHRLDRVQDGLVEVVKENLSIPCSRGEHQRPERRPAAAKQVRLAGLQLHHWRYLKHVVHTQGAVRPARGKYIPLKGRRAEVVHRTAVPAVVRFHWAPQLRNLSVRELLLKVVAHGLIVVQQTLEDGSALRTGHETARVALLRRLKRQRSRAPRHHFVAPWIPVHQLIAVYGVVQLRPLPHQHAALVSEGDDMVRLVLIRVPRGSLRIVLPPHLANRFAVRRIGALGAADLRVALPAQVPHHQLPVEGAARDQRGVPGVEGTAHETTVCLELRVRAARVEVAADKVPADQCSGRSTPPLNIVAPQRGSHHVAALVPCHTGDHQLVRVGGALGEAAQLVCTLHRPLEVVAHKVRLRKGSATQILGQDLLHNGRDPLQEGP